MSLEAEVRELRDALSEAHTHTQDIERLSRVTGEADVLRRRLQELEEMRAVLDYSTPETNHSLVVQRERSEYTERLEELNTRLQDGETIRRKLHNTIQV
jgi:chromosome segregation ATPase